MDGRDAGLLSTPHADVAASLPDETVAWFAGCGGKIVTVAGNGIPGVERIPDIDGTYAGWFAEHAVTAVLQRPDFHLFGSAATAGHARALLDALRDALERPQTLVPTAAGGTR